MSLNLVPFGLPVSLPILSLFRLTAMESALCDGLCFVETVDILPGSMSTFGNEQHGNHSRRQWHPCQYCGFMVVQRRLCACRQVWYCDDLCYRKDKRTHRRICLWRRHRLVVLHWQPCTYCGFGICARRMCPCRQAWYCDELCQRRDWQAHKRQCLWHRHRCAERFLMSATLPEALVAGILRAASIQSRDSA